MRWKPTVRVCPLAVAEEGHSRDRTITEVVSEQNVLERSVVEVDPALKAIATAFWSG